MIERRNLKLVGILTIWFVLISILPASLVFVAMRRSLEAQAHQQAERAMGFLVRSKATDLVSMVGRQEESLAGLVRTLDEELSKNVSAGFDIREFIARQSPAVPEVNLYFVGPDKKVVSEVSFVSGEVWLPQDVTEDDVAFLIDRKQVYIARRLSLPNAWLVFVTRPSALENILRADVNDRSFYSARSAEDSALAYGNTADIALVGPDGSLLVPPTLYSESEVRAQYRYLSSQKKVFSQFVSSEQGRVLIRTYPILFAGGTYALVALQSEAEVTRAVSEGIRNHLLAGIASLIGLLLLLYMFVVTVGRIVVRPIYLSVRDLLQLGERLSANMQGTEGVMKDQLSVSKKLVASHTSQLSDMKQVNDELNAIVREFKTIMAATSVTARSAADINVAARESGAQAQKARDGIVDIKRLASSHEAMVTTLSHYSAEVAGIARDIESLSRAIAYLSLNATIEGSGRARSGKSLTRLVSEAGKLARVSHESSARIHELLARIQRSLQQTTHSAKLEVVSSQASTAVINDALGRLATMSRDTEAIASSVNKINALISMQRGRIDTIFGRSESVALQARDTMRSAVMVSNVAEKQRASIRSTSTMLKKLRTTIETLHNLIDRKRT